MRRSADQSEQKHAEEKRSTKEASCCEKMKAYTEAKITKEYKE
jgi:hypothetical protein